MVTELFEVTINEQWKLKVPEHRVDIWSRPWEPERIDSMHKNVRKGNIVYDVGAEQFDMSALIASWGAEMVLIEPSKWGWPTGRAIWEGNDLPAPLICFEGFAGSNYEANKNFIIGGDWPKSAYEPINVKEGFAVINQRPDIQQTVLDNIVSYRPDIITMDVEGAEFEVLKGADELLMNTRPLIYISEHPEFMFNTFKQYQSEMHSFLHAHGYQGKFLAMDHEQHWLWWHPEGRLPVEAL